MGNGDGRSSKMGGGQMSENMQCGTCRHYQMPTNKCAAFPGLHLDPNGNYVDGLEIPYEIWIGDFDHRLPYEGDNGIRFESVPEFADIWAATPIESATE